MSKVCAQKTFNIQKMYGKKSVFSSISEINKNIKSGPNIFCNIAIAVFADTYSFFNEQIIKQPVLPGLQKRLNYIIIKLSQYYFVQFYSIYYRIIQEKLCIAFWTNH